MSADAVTSSAPYCRHRPTGGSTPALMLLATLGACLLLVSCGGPVPLDGPGAVERYDQVADEVAAAIREEVPSLSADGENPTIQQVDEGCRITAVSYASDDLIGDDVDLESGPVIAAADAALADHGFSTLEADAEHPTPMQAFVATDDTGGSVRVVIESRPGLPTVRMWWSAQVDTQGAPCDEDLLR